MTGGARSYGAGARLLSLGIASTGVVTFAYFSVASYVLDDVDYAQISLLWSVLFVTVSVIYRPIEQLLSRTIAERRARGLESDHPLRTPLLLQGGFALIVVALAAALHGRILDGLLDGDEALYWVLVSAIVLYAASYFARGWLAGHQRFGLYGGLVFLEATTRLLFALAVAVGIAAGETAVALGMAAAPLVSLIVLPLSFRRRRGAATAPAPAPAGGDATPAVNGATPAGEEAAPGLQSAATTGGPGAVDEGLGLARGGRFALAALAIMLAEQTLINGAVLTVDATAADAAAAGFVFNALLIARAPLQLFQAIQGSLLPHLAGLHVRTEGGEEFRRAVRVTILAIIAFAGTVAVGLLAVGPWVMDVLFDAGTTYGRVGLAVVAVGMGLHLIAGTLNQAALARDHAVAAAACWLIAAALFLAWMLSSLVADQLLRAEVGYAGAAGVLCALLAVVHRRAHTA